MNKKVMFIIIFMVFLFLPYSFIGGQESSQQKKNEQELKHEVSVVLKLIQVYVLDKDKQPVTDLEKYDFTLWDNGEQKTITEFERYILFSPPLKKTTIKTETPAPSSRQFGRKFILFFDFAFNSTRGLERSKKAALYFIDTSLFPTDDVSILSYSPLGGINLHADLTQEHHVIRRIVMNFGVGKVLGRARDLSSSETDKLVQNIHMSEYNNFIHIYIKTMKDLAKALRYVPGHKHIIFYSSGIKYNGLLGYLRDYEEMTREMTASNCTIHSIYTEAMDDDMDIEIDRDTYVWDRGLLEIPKKDIKETGAPSLGRLSELTGGRYFGNIHNYEEITEEIQEVTGSYYVLGYYVTEKWDGKYHDIKVKVDRKSCLVQTQKGYFNPKPFSKFSDMEKEMHLMGLATNHTSVFGAPLNLSMVALSFSDKKEPNVIVFTEIDPDKTEDVLNDEVEIVTFVFNEANEIKNQIKVKMNLLDALKKKSYLYSLFSLEPGDYKSSVVLHNLKTGEAAVASSSFSIPILYNGIHLFPPLVFIPGEEADYISIKEKLKGKDPVILELGDIYPALSGRTSLMAGELAKGIRSLSAEVRCLIIGIQDPEIDLSASLKSLSNPQEEIPISFLILSGKEEQDMDILLMEFNLPELEKGEYSLALTAQDTKTKSKSQVNISFKIK